MRSAPLVLLGGLLAVAPVTLLAQAPRVTPGGDPSVQDDTIYALTVDASDHPEEDYVVLLDDGILIREPDGTGSRTYRMVAQVLQREGVETWAEHSFSYDGDREDFRLNWIRVLDLDGNVISDTPLHEQVMDFPVPEQSPVYTDWKRVRVSVAGVEPGTIVDYSYTVETREPVREGDYFSSWRITTGGTVRRSRLVLDVPESSEFRIREDHVDFEPRVTVSNGRRVREWFAADLERIEPEMFSAVGESGLLKSVQVAGPSGWNEIGAWYASLAADRYAVDQATLEAAREAVADAESDLARLQALYRWIAQDFRYISISLGTGGYQPRPAPEVFQTRSGDCKDKATLFIGLAREMGFEAYPVLLSSSGGVAEDLPSVSQFDHVIAAVRNGDGGWTYLDLTAEIIPFGEVSPSYQGEFGVVVQDDGAVEAITFPEAPPEENYQRTFLHGELLPDGTFKGWYEELTLGAFQYESRSTFSQEFTPRQIDRIADAIAAGVMDGGVGDSLQLFNGRDLEATPLVKVHVTAPRVARDNGPVGWIMPVPLGSFAAGPTVEGLEREMDSRITPIDVGQVIGPILLEARLEITLPEGWTVTLPEPVRVDGDFGRYETDYTQDGRVFRIVRRISGREGTEPRERLADLIEFFREIGEDDVSFVVLTPGAAGATTP